MLLIVKWQLLHSKPFSAFYTHHDIQNITRICNGIKSIAMKFYNLSESAGKRAAGKKTDGKSLFRRVNDWLHLWLGLASGIIVLIVCVTGCIWVFNEEITMLMEPENNVVVENKTTIAPSEIRHIVSGLYPGKKVTYANYHQGRAINVGVGQWEDKIRYTVKLNPYSGKVLSIVTHHKDETDFFRWVLNGHRFLWLPYEIGRPIVNYGTLIFVVLLITGLIWWYPKKWTQSTRDKSFKIKWNGSFKRVNLDLHNVLGFYSLLFLLAIALTGMVWGIEWYSKGLYWTTSGGQTLPEWKESASDSLQLNKFYKPDQAMNKAWASVAKAHPDAQGFYYSYPDTLDAKSTIGITIYPSAHQFYNNESYTFDRHTLKRLSDNELYDTPYAQASFGARLRRMNYDIHIGSILGFPGKVLAFFSSLIGASLPVTGFIIWWGKRKKKPKKLKGQPAEDLPSTNTVYTQKKVPAFKPGQAKSRSGIRSASVQHNLNDQ